MSDFFSFRSMGIGVCLLLLVGVSTVLLQVGQRFSTFSMAKYKEQNKEIPLSIGAWAIQVAVADTAALRSRGLSGRPALPEGHGLLFVFEKPGRYGFWMKDMHISIDIIWIDDSKKIIGVEKDVSPNSYPRIFYPPAAVSYVLEVPPRFYEKTGLEVGMQVMF